jgi:nucleotide-binding universal stress UspA family protein
MSVVAGVDESDMSRLVVERAIEQTRWRQTDLHLVHASHMPVPYTEVPIDWTEILEARRASVWAGLDPLLEDVDVALQRVDLDGYPPDALVEYASLVGASLLVLGSTSHRAIHLSRCDILVVKEPGG